MEVSKKRKRKPRVDYKSYEGSMVGDCKVIAYKAPAGKHPARFEVLCSCGNYFTCIGNNLLTGKVRSCGCYRSSYMRSTKSKRDEWYSYIGSRFGLLTVLGLEELDDSINGRVYLYEVGCYCGNVFKIAREHLMYNHVVSCGCIQSVSNRASHFVRKLGLGRVSVEDWFSDSYFSGIGLGLDSSGSWDGTYYVYGSSGEVIQSGFSKFKDAFVVSRSLGLLEG